MNISIHTKKLFLYTYVFVFILFFGSGAFSSELNGNQFNFFTNTEYSFLYYLLIPNTLYIISAIYTILFPPVINQYESHIFSDNFEAGDIEKGLGFLSFRFVTKGINKTTIYNSVSDLLFLLKKVPRNLWNIEIVSDIDLVLEKDENVFLILVPDVYKINYNGSETKYKARALQYALDTSSFKGTRHLVHLDEETHMDFNTVVELYKFISKNPDKIGQGCITYMRNYNFESIIHFFNTLTDSIRITDDMGRFRLQFQLGIPLTGMKGSYVVIKEDIEKQVGFNYGENGSITEDCHFALKAWSKGYNFGYIPALMYERSPFTITDFIKQRSRWHKGLWKVVTSYTIPLKNRILLGILMVIWCLAPLYLFLGIFIISTKTSSPNIGISVIRDLYLYFYIYGTMFSLIYNNSYFTFFPILILQIISLPYAIVMEISGVFHAWYSMFKGTWDFHVVKK
jgi:egghead protein (zeste-white 4 protein)